MVRLEAMSCAGESGSGKLARQVYSPACDGKSESNVRFLETPTPSIIKSPMLIPPPSVMRVPSAPIHSTSVVTEAPSIRSAKHSSV